MAKKKPTLRSAKTKKATKSKSRKSPKRKSAASMKTTGKKTAGKKPTGKKTVRKKTTGKKSTTQAQSAPKQPTRKKFSTGSTGKRTAKQTRASGSAAVDSVASPSMPQVSSAESTTRPTRGKPGRNRHSTLNAAARGERAARVAEPRPAVANPVPERGGTAKRAARTKRDERMSTAPPPEPRTPKTRLTDKQLREFKDMLLAKRAELLSDVRMLTKDALGKSRKDSSGDLSSMPIHMADIGSDNWEQDFTLGLIANERQLVREIDEALQRIEERTYGVCLATHKPITVARLRAKPWAKYCIEYAQQLERRGY